MGAAAAIPPGRPSGADYVPPTSPPPEFQSLYGELSQALTAFETQLDSEWDGCVGDARFAAGLSAANGNKSVGLLSATNWTRIVEMLDAFEAMGVGLVKIDVHYPVFTPAFHTYLQANPPPLVPNYTYTVDDFIGHPTSFYNKLADEIRSRGMGLWIEHSTLFNDWSTTPPSGYFADIRAAGVAAGRARYLEERTAEMALVASELSPDYYTLVDEPTTQNDNFGYFPGGIPILTADGWRDLVQDAAADIAAAVPGYTSLLGAGSGTWEGRDYTERFAALTELDYIDFHLYPLASNTEDYAQNVLEWSDYVRGVDPTKKLTLGEAWLYKASASEVSGGLDPNTIFGRDTYSFWEPLDRQYLDVLFKITHDKGFEAVMPYWSQYYFAYLTYGDPELEGLNGIQLVTRAGQEALPNIASVTLTGTGEKLVGILAAEPSTFHCNDDDGDGVPDVADNCPAWPNADQSLPPWPVPTDDPDCDGFTDTDEGVIGTDPADWCPDDPSDDTWPCDFDMNRVINILDVGEVLPPYFGTSVPPTSPRRDLVPDGFINILDVGMTLPPYFGSSCTP